MKVLHVISGISRSAGGPSRSSQGLVASLCKAGVDAWIYPLDGSEPWIEGVRKISGIVDFEQAARTPLPRSWRLDEFNLVHIHGIWDLRLHKVAVACRRSGVPYVIAPRGMLEPWPLKQKWLKKRIARFLYQDRDLNSAAALHATAESEAEQFRRLGFKNRIIISPNGVNVPEGDLGTQVASRHANLAKSDVATTPTSSATPQSAFCQGSSRRALFVSRMHPKKGVLELVESWARVKPTGWCCELVYTMNSEEERAYEQKVKDRILSLGMTYSEGDNSTVRLQPSPSPKSTDFIFTGPLDDDSKWSAYARADLFVLPTYSENFGIVVAEALWAGVPVITTKGTPWKELEDFKCGWWVDLSELDSALRDATSTSDLDLDLLGRNGRALVSDRYTWAAVTETVVEGYNDILK